MAWIRWRQTTGGRRLATVQWRGPNGRVRSQALKTSDERLVDIHLRRARQLEGKKGPRSVVSDDPMTALRHFLQEKAVTVGSANSVVPYRARLNPLFRAWADQPMSQWNRRDFVSYIAARDWAPATIHKLRNYSRQFIAWAQENDLPCADFVGNFKAPPIRVHDVEVLTPEQALAVLEEARGHYLELPIALSMFAGMDPSDFRSLDWSEVNFKAGIIKRRRNKTNAAIEIPIQPFLRDALGRNRALRGPVCRDLPDCTSNLSKALHRLCKRAGIPRAPKGQSGFRRFRHTQATLLARAGADVATIGRSLGHRKGSNMALRYVESDREQLDRGLGAIDRQIREAAGGE